MQQMPEASAIIHAWFIDISNMQFVEGDEIFRNLEERLSEAKTIWQQAAKDLAGSPHDMPLLRKNVKYQTIDSLVVLANTLRSMWSNSYILPTAIAEKPSE